MAKIIEMTDAVSMFGNKLQTLTETVVREGEILHSGIKLFYFDRDHERILIRCEVDGTKTSILLKKEERLPFGESRSMIKESGMAEVLFQSSDDPVESSWFFVDNIRDDDNKVEYVPKNTFLDSYKETPIRDLLSPYDVHARLVLYFPVEGKQENVDGIAVIEIGNDLYKRSGLIYYYSFRIIPEEFIEEL
jgi:hypothetical protein